MKWITRERPKIDHIACPWLIKKFVDTDAEFLYVAKEKVFEKAKELEAIPYDIPGAEYFHYEDGCTVDYIIRKHNLTDEALKQLATIVRGADTDHLIWPCRRRACGQFSPDFHTISKTIANSWKLV